MSEVASTPLRYKLSVEDYHRLGEAGVLNEDSRVELIEGELVQMEPIGGPHMWAVTKLMKLLVMAAGESAIVSSQNPVILSNDTEPQPDFSIIKISHDRDRSHPPGPADILLVIEVSDTTLTYDRHTKLRLYARAAIPECWIVDIRARRVEIYRTPQGDQYQSRSL